MFGNTRWQLFELLGHKVYMEPWFLLLLAFFLGPVATGSQLVEGLLWVPIIFFSILLHEVGHAVAIKRSGFGNSIIVLQGLGGVTINQRRSLSAPKTSIFISAAGPAFSLALALIFAVIYLAVVGNLSPGNVVSVGLFGIFGQWATPTLWSSFLYKMAAINGFWFLFNMLPISPMDGGHIMESAMEMAFGDRNRALLTAAYVSMVALVILAFVSFVILRQSGLLLIVLVGLFGYHNWRTIESLRGRVRR